MRIITIATILAVAISCEDKKQDSRMDLDEMIADKHNEYLASLEEGNLTMFGYYGLIDISDSLHLNRFTKSSENFESEGEIQTVDVYVFDKSFLKKYFNNHPQVNQLDLVSGRILNAELINSSVIQLDMTKEDFLGVFFQTSKLFDEIDTVTIYRSEEGLAHTSYIFEDDQLSQIIFDSAYDWIDKDLR